MATDDAHPFAYLGVATEKDYEHLSAALAIAATYEPLLDGLRWPGPEGSEVHRLDSSVGGTITVTDTLVSSQRTARASVLHLTTLFEQGMAPRASVAVTLSRAALLCSTRVIYILGPADPRERVRNAERVIRTQATSQLRAIRRFSNFGVLKGIQAPSELVDSLKLVLDELPQGHVTDTEMIASAASIIGSWLMSRGAEESPKALEDHLAWVWNNWSGIAHGWAWPKYVPGRDDPNVDTAPGSWVLDFRTVAMTLHLALKMFAQAFDPHQPQTPVGRAVC